MKSYIRGRAVMLLVAGAAQLFSASCSSDKSRMSDAQLGLNPQQAAGRQVFNRNCAVCHTAYTSETHGGPSLEGLFRKGELPSGAPANDTRVREAILQGRAQMPPFKYTLSQQQVDELLAYLHTL
jgi:mono/diheme cytochrome c family protein